MTGTNGRRPGQWAEEEEALIRHYWNDMGLSAGVIGVMMSKSRNSIIGKARRLKLNVRRTAVRLPRKDKVVRVFGIKKRRQTNRNFSVPRPPKPERVAPTFVPLTEIVPLNGVGVDFLELHSGHCHAVIRGHNRDTGELARYCGHSVVEGESYCADHYVAFHQPPRPRKAVFTLPRLG